jgi:hypothetical protein
MFPHVGNRYGWHSLSIELRDQFGVSQKHTRYKCSCYFRSICSDYFTCIYLNCNRSTIIDQSCLQNICWNTCILKKVMYQKCAWICMWNMEQLWQDWRYILCIIGINLTVFLWNTNSRSMIWYKLVFLSFSLNFLSGTWLWVWQWWVSCLCAWKITVRETEARFSVKEHSAFHASA